VSGVHLDYKKNINELAVEVANPQHTGPLPYKRLMSPEMIAWAGASSNYSHFRFPKPCSNYTTRFVFRKH
jgi:hypothetical protein